MTIINEANAKLIAQEFSHLHLEQIFYRIRAYSKLCNAPDNMTIKEFFDDLLGRKPFIPVRPKNEDTQ